ncbi:N-terminal acetyltransferase [Planctomycetales bacterium 10988]|nr:N-terminal acetyltransferase [Planctomycetales bacterium 10988]
MALTYFKRFRMEFDLTNYFIPAYAMPAGYHLIPWEHTQLEHHAEAKFNSFRHEIDANVFPCLGDSAGCLRLMGDISRKPGFLEEATWLAVYQNAPKTKSYTYCGTIQGICDAYQFGAIQNLGVVPDHRGHGLGKILLWHALEGFKRAGLERCFLEVTAHNEGAIGLYERLGFHKVRTLYKVVETNYC